MRLFFAVLFSCMSATVCAQRHAFTIDGHNRMTPENSWRPIANTRYSFQFKNSVFGLCSFASVATERVQIVAGPAVTFPVDTNVIIRVAGALGADYVNSHWAMRGIMWVQVVHTPNKGHRKGETQALFHTEHGHSGYSYLSYVTYNIVDECGVGLQGEYNGVLGGRIQLFPHYRFMMYGVGGWNFEQNVPGFIFGLQGLW
jgi:hypothetical protein